MSKPAVRNELIPLSVDDKVFLKLQSVPFHLLSHTCAPVEVDGNTLFLRDFHDTSNGIPRYKSNSDEWDVFMNKTEISPTGPMTLNKLSNKLYIFADSNEQWKILDMNSKSITTFDKMDGLGDYANACSGLFAFNFNGRVHIIGQEYNEFDYNRNSRPAMFAHWSLNEVNEVNEQSSKYTFQAIHEIDSKMMGRFNSSRIKIFIPRRKEILFIKSEWIMVYSVLSNQCKIYPHNAGYGDKFIYWHAILSQDENHIIINAIHMCEFVKFQGQNNYNRLIVIDINYDGSESENESENENPYCMRDKMIKTENMMRVNVAWKSHQNNSEMDKILVVGYVKELFKLIILVSFEDIQMLPIYLMHIIALFYSTETLHIVEEKKDRDSQQNHFCLPVKHILNITS